MFFVILLLLIVIIPALYTPPPYCEPALAVTTQLLTVNVPEFSMPVVPPVIVRPLRVVVVAAYTSITGNCNVVPGTFPIKVTPAFGASISILSPGHEFTRPSVALREMVWVVEKV